MEFEYRGKNYVLYELIDPFGSGTSGIIQIMEVIYIEEFDINHYKFINYFYGARVLKKNEVLEIAKGYIDSIIDGDSDER